MLFLVDHHLGDSWKSAREALTSRLLCFTTGFPGGPNGSSLQPPSIRSNPVHRCGTSKQQSGKDVKQLIVELNPVLRGWGNYFRTGNADREFNSLDHFVVQSLRRWQYRRGGRRPTRRPSFTHNQLYAMGLHRLMGTVRYPMQATPRRSSLSRVSENGMHGLKGDAMETGQPR
ncbi:MAG: group II intron maturase-specific domain-containing protein [Candidatus Sulfotelmatobacter sp.]